MLSLTHPRLLHAVGLAAAWLCLGHTTLTRAQVKRVQLDVLLLSDGDAGASMVKAGLDESLVPYTEVNLTAGDRPQITDAFLSDVVEQDIRRAKYQAVIMPNNAPTQLSAAELSALESYEREFNVRELDAYLYPTSAIGLGEPGFSGSLDGVIASPTAAAKSEGFDYLKGGFAFDNLSTSVDESYGYLASPLPDDVPNGRSFVAFIEAPLPNSSQGGVIVGVYHDNGRERMVVTAAMNETQLQQQLLFPGMLEWLTYGVHFGHERYSLTVHIDDVFLPDDRWDTDHNCTVGDGCPADVTAPEIFMTEADVTYLADWQNQHGMKLDLVWNGQGLDEAEAQIPASIASNNALRWISHTYTHEYLGCVEDFSVTPWVCKTSDGQTQWASQTDIEYEITQNISFATQRGIQHDATALVTGEHSGLRRSPEEPSDNPSLAAALTGTGVHWIASDNSREAEQRQIGSALTIPRFPMNIYYNAGTKLEEADEYNWIYNSVADGGSGICERNPQTSTCIAPLDTASGFEDHIVPEQVRQMIMPVLGNSPKPFYAHQSNLAEDRILYAPLNLLLQQYSELLASNTPLSNPTMAEAGTELSRRASWKNARSHIHAYVQDQKLFVTGDEGGDGATPVTVPAAADAPNLESFGSKRTGWVSVSSGASANYQLPDSVRYARGAVQQAPAVPSNGRNASLGLVLMLLASGLLARRRGLSKAA